MDSANFINSFKSTLRSLPNIYEKNLIIDVWKGLKYAPGWGYMQKQYMLKLVSEVTQNFVGKKHYHFSEFMQWETFHFY